MRVIFNKANGQKIAQTTSTLVDFSDIKVDLENRGVEYIEVVVSDKLSEDIFTKALSGYSFNLIFDSDILIDIDESEIIPEPNKSEFEILQEENQRLWDTVKWLLEAGGYVPSEVIE